MHHDRAMSANDPDDLVATVALPRKMRWKGDLAATESADPAVMEEAALQRATRALARSHGLPVSNAAQRNVVAESDRTGAGPGTQTMDRVAKQSRRCSNTYNKIGDS
jgi:hypothetical protein